MKKNLFFMVLWLNLFAESEIGCNIIVKPEPLGCSISNILNTASTTLVEEKISIKSKTMAITEKLNFVEVLHNEKKLRIERSIVGEEETCPPFCIEPMSIKGVQTVGELETLDFIDKLKEKNARLLIDVRESSDYLKFTIPGALNLPLSMLKDGSEYQTEVLKLLGAQLSNGKWIFRNTQFLLIFGSSATTNEASIAVKQLLKLGYPSTKLLYYRAGIESWKALGLTTS